MPPRFNSRFATPCFAQGGKIDPRFDLSTLYLERIIRRVARRERPFDIPPAFEALTVFVNSTKLSRPCIGTGFMAELLRLPAILLISERFAGRLEEKPQDDLGEDRSSIKLDCTSSSLTRLDLAA